jgi:recombination protein RecA
MRSSTASLRLHIESALAGRVASPFRLREAVLPPVVPIGIPALDEFAGGLPRGSLTEIYGPVCSGKTSILHSALASRTSAAEACALVDAQDAFDPISSQLSGVFLPKLLWVRAHRLEQAFRCVDLLLHGGGFGFVVLDIADAPIRLVRKVPLNVWFRLRRAVEDTSTILLVLSQESNAKTCASLVLRLERETTMWSQPSCKSVSEFHTPGCLLDKATHVAEAVRSLRQYKWPHPIDQSVSGNSDATVRFGLNSNPYAEPGRFPESESKTLFLPLPEEPQEEWQEERMQNPG